MESSYGFKTSAVISSTLVVILCYYIARIMYKFWWKPYHIKRTFKRQGIRGTCYNRFSGDMDEMRRTSMEALSKPMSLMDHHIAPRVSAYLHNMIQKYGKVCLCWSGSRARLIVGDSEMVRSILSNKNGHFGNSPLNPLVELLQQGLSTLEGQQWASRRKLMTPAFHLDKIKGMLPAFTESCSTMIDRWKELTSGGPCEVDVAPELQTFTSDVISRTAFGSSYQEGKTLFELLKHQAVLVLEAYHSFYFPGLRFIPTTKNRRRYRLNSEIKAILLEMIRKREQAMKTNRQDVDLLGLLLLQNKQEGDENNNSNTSMSMDDIMEECKLFFIAGQETSASLLTWTMIVLSMHPDWQQKARQEVLCLCGNNQLPPTFDAINHLKIVTMVLNEVLRLYSPLTYLKRCAKQNTSVAGISIPAGTETMLYTLSLHTDPNYWGDDALQFNPERFWDGGPGKAAFFPFGWGPKTCLGQNFALIESKMALAMILQHFSFELSPSYTHAPIAGLTVHTQYGAPVILHRLSSP